MTPISLSDRLLPTNKNNPCHISGRTDGTCRTKDNEEQAVLCACTPTAKKGDREGPYICVDDNAKGHTTHIWVLHRSNFAAEEWENRKIERELEEKRKLLERNKKSLSPDIRHQHYEQIFNCLELNQTTVVDLEQRGFTQIEIDNCGFKSVVKDQKIPLQVPDDLPGVGKYGFSLIVADDGFLCPVKDPQGRITGWQLRIYKVEKGNKYRWGNDSSRQVLGLPVDGGVENPLAVFRPQVEPKGIGLCEGTGPKPYLASSRLNLIIIGASGGQFASSPKLLEQYLGDISQELGGTKELTIFPDAGDIINKNVLKRWKNLCELLTKLGYTYKFAWWEQTTKEHLDIDELTDFSQIQYISGSEFFTIAELGTKNAEVKKLQDKDYEQCKAIRDKLSTITEQNVKRINVSHIGEVLPSLLQNKAVNIIISDTGTGKTEGIKSTVDQADAVHSWHDRISLAKANAKKLVFAYKDEALDSNHANKKKVAFCTPSCTSFNPKDLRENGIALIDEADQVFDFNFGSLANKDGIRPLILSTMQASIKASVYDGKAIFMSADITQKEIDYIKAMLPPGIPVNIIINEFRAVKPSINFDISSSPEGQLKTLMAKLANRIPCFAMDDMKNGVKGGKTLAEYVRLNMPELSELILEINADVIGDSKVKAFFDNPNEESKKYLLIICSPSVISGLNLTNQRFIHGVFAFCNGILMDKQIKQFINRIRGGKDIYLWVAEKGFRPKGINSDLLEVEEIREYYKANYQSNSKHILSFKAEYEPMTDEFTSHHFELNIKNLAHKAATSRYLRQFAKEHLESVGYGINEIESISKEEAKEIRSDLKVCWNGIEIKEALEIDNARFLTDSEMEAIELGGKEVTAELRPAYLKTRMRRDFGEKLIEATEYEHKKTKQIFTGYAAMALKNAGNRFKRQLDNFYLLSQSVDESAARDYATEFRQLKHGEGRFAGDITWNARARKCREWLGMPELLNIQEWIEAEDYKAIIERAKLYPEQLRTVLNLTTDKKTNGQILGELFDQIGLKFETKEIEGRKIKLRRISADSLNYAKMYVEYRLSLKTAVEEVAEAEPVAEVVKVEELPEIQPETAIAVQHQQLNLLDPIQPEEISQVNEFGSRPPIYDPVFGDVELIREFVAAADWGSTHVHLAKFDEVSQKRILQQLTIEERKILDSLKPLDEEEVKAKEIIDIIKSGKDVRVRCDRALIGVDNRQNLTYYLHPNYHYLLFPKSQDLVA